MNKNTETAVTAPAAFDFATRAVEVGFEIKSLSEVLGHANTTITLDRYVHSSMKLKRDNMSKLATAWH